MKKIYIFIITLLLFIPAFSVDAASSTISVSANRSRVIVGETVTVTVKVSSATSLGSWRFDVVPSSNLSLTSSSFGGLYVVDYASNGSLKTKTYTFTFKAKSSGKGSVSIKNSEVVGYDELSMSVNNGSTSFTLMTQSELEATYSKNNNLKSLTIAGYDLNPTFSKDVLEYSVEVPNGTEKVKIGATKEDSTASIKGTGEFEVSEGVNKFEITVTAQNGSTKKYVVNVTVKELDPIIVNVDSNEYNVIRKSELLPSINMYFKEDTILINGYEVPCYYNEKASITLVGLKNNIGNVNLYIYDDGKYTLYNELSFNQMYIKILDMDETLLKDKYTKERIEINNTSVVAYKKENSEIYLIYGLNLESGEKNIYKYDKVEHTIQRYEEIVNNDELYYLIILGLLGFITVSYIIFIIILIKNNNKKTRLLEDTMRINIENINKESVKETLENDITDEIKVTKVEEELEPYEIDEETLRKLEKTMNLDEETIKTLENTIKINKDDIKKSENNNKKHNKKKKNKTKK